MESKRVGWILLGVAGAILAYYAGQSAANRIDDYNQNLVQALLGGMADTTGVSDIYAGIYNRDIISGEHAGLSSSEQRRKLVRGFLR